MTFILGMLAGAVAVLLYQHLTKRPAEPMDEQAQRRRERLMREYRNFLTYDGFAPQDEGE